MAHGLDNVLKCAQTDRRLQVSNSYLIGPGAEREELVRIASDLGLRNVIFVPPQPKETMPDFWKSLSNVALVHLKNAALFKTVIPSEDL